jgi:phage portal protein, SPP1 family|nr:MAG TPA: PORTAL PROTEIN [Caudoviricetes sp.]
MYTLPKETKFDNDIARKVIEYNEKYTKRYNKLWSYYIGKQDILDRKKGELSFNNKVMVNHAKYITDTNIGYLLGNPVDYQVNEKYQKSLEVLLKEYNKQTISDLDSEIAKSISIFGNQHEYIYSNENAEPKSCQIDNSNAIIVYDDTVEHNKLFGLIYRGIYDGENFSHYEIIYCDKKKIVTYKSTTKSLIKEGKEEIHKFGDVPLIEYKNNPEYLGDFENVISLIDAYNTLQSDRINDKEQLVDAILLFYNMSISSDQAEEIKRSRMISEIPPEGRAEYLVKQLNESQVDILRSNIEKDIHKISMTPNMSDENFVGNSSGVALRYKLLAFEQNIKNKSRYMEKGLKERFKLYNNFLNVNSKMEIIPIEEVDVVFTRNLPTNDYETSQMINNLTDLVDRETLISQLSFIKDASDILEAKDREDEKLNQNEIPNINKEHDHKEEVDEE